MSVVTQESDISIIRTVQTERVVVRQIPAPGPPGPPGDFPLSLKTEFEFDQLNPSNHKEIVYDDERIVAVNIFDSSEKNFQIFSKLFEYNSLGKIFRVTTNFLLAGSQLIKTLSYDSNSKIISVDRFYLP